MNRLLKWAIQITAMLGDLMLLAACMVMIYHTLKVGSLLLAVITIILIFMSYNAWKSQGGLIAWRNREQFMRNWDKLTKRVE